MLCFTISGRTLLIKRKDSKSNERTAHTQNGSKIWDLKFPIAEKQANTATVNVSGYKIARLTDMVVSSALTKKGGKMK